MIIYSLISPLEVLYCKSRFNVGPPTVIIEDALLLLLFDFCGNLLLEKLYAALIVA